MGVLFARFIRYMLDDVPMDKFGHLNSKFCSDRVDVLESASARKPHSKLAACH